VLILLIVIETCLAVAAQLLLRHGAMRLQGQALAADFLLEPLRNFPIFAGLVLHGASFYLYIYILSRIRLNVLYPVATGASLVLITIFSVILLKEAISLPQAIGIVTIMVGIALVFVPG
jgi:multidrug transporter EmrE-like cation transporter